MSKETQFFDALRNVFIGEQVEGESGFVNLMHIKSLYYERGVFPRLQEDINRALERFPEFREEFFDRLYTFFRRYFSESGSIYFRFTPPHEHVYEQVYTDERDVTLFWKTHMLYYVKTDRLFRSMVVEIDGFKFFFDVSSLENKRSNEKRTLVYDFKERRDDATLVFTVTYSERGRQTNIDGVRRAIKNALHLNQYTAAIPSAEILKRAFRVFERQSEVDYFINKNARQFLRDQFNLWLYQYVFEPEQRQGTVWTEQRVRQLQILKEIAYKIIDFIAQFEDELVRIWNKPKFVLGSHYVITLDRIAAQDRGVAVLERLLIHPGMESQVREWQELGMVGEDFSPKEVWLEELKGKHLHERYQYLPIDTKHFPDLEGLILALFNHLDQELDGWLVHSENYQALNTMLPKFRGRVDFNYIDPPYNTQYSEIAYVNHYKHASWLTLMENRLVVSRNWLGSQAIYCISIDDVETAKLNQLLELVFNGWEKSFVTVVHNQRGQQSKNFSVVHEYLYFLYPDNERKYISDRPRETSDFRNLRDSGSESHREDAANCFYPILVKGNKIIGFGDIPPDDFHPPAANEEKNDVIYVWPIDSNGKERKWRYARQSIETVADKLEAVITSKGVQIYLSKELQMARTVWYGSHFDASEYGTKVLKEILGERIAEEFKYPKSIGLMEETLQHSELLQKGTGLVLDFFAGSGTTAHAVINLNREDGGQRKYILIEMADYFHTALLPRIKKVVFSDQWKDGKAQDGGKGISHFFKYFRVEQYEDVLRKARYGDDDVPLFFQDPYTQYVFLRDSKMLDNAETGDRIMEMNPANDEIRVDLSKLYPDVDLAETLSCLTGKWIRRIHPLDEDPTKAGVVEFEDGTSIDLQNPPWQFVKPLIWWGE